jgi:hypothetical protein
MTEQRIRRWQEVSNAETAAVVGDGVRVWQRETDDGHLSVFLSHEPPGWHLSISHRTNVLGPNGRPMPGRYPTWDEIVDARYLFAPPDVTMAMLLPPGDEYVNVHQTTFHLWEIAVTRGGER